MHKHTHMLFGLLLGAIKIPAKATWKEFLHRPMPSTGWRRQVSCSHRLRPDSTEMTRSQAQLRQKPRKRVFTLWFPFLTCWPQASVFTANISCWQNLF